ncbi:thioredoxin [Alteromonas sp. KS69]|uniref:thioredoxin family protein n=1 Tax=unclassified Alteromonas TaxID=2614992 RepID=UPI000F85CA74|nr:thioredoxin family protein [Alteromonas sp. KS69]MBO7923018.1 thioredoxin family protein [Alteromonas sp. K632G]RUP79369.1 thioredoxin [Alteromonas sp. KS69]
MFADKFMFSVLKPILAVLIVMVSTNAMSADDISEVVGEMSGEALLAQYPAFMDEYKSYQPSDAEIKAVSALEDDTLLILFGTWCHDSEREVPRLLKTLDASGLDVPQFTLFAVDRKKSDPEGVAEKHGLKYTPTFILMRDGEEIGRVVERAETSLTQDLQALAAAAE